jgi:hypothetical protein
MSKFLNIEYLRSGNEVQQNVYRILEETRILSILSDFEPILTGTIPIEINIANSDIDIICNVNDFEAFSSIVKDSFSLYRSFSEKIDKDCYVAGFEYSGFLIEIYGERRSTISQNAYRHMLIEHRILDIAGEPFREKVIELKKQGYKTEPAFGLILNLQNPYEDLLGLEELEDNELQIFISEAGDALLDK